MTATDWSGFPSEADLRAVAGDDPDGDALVDLIQECRAEIEEACRELVWRDEEVIAAMARHPAQADRVWHMAPLLWPLPAFRFPDLDWFWRGHFRELLDRAGRGEDTTLATYPEICLLMSEASKTAPLRTDAFGLYVRAWCTAFPDGPGAEVGIGTLGGELAHYEKMNGTGMDHLERLARDAVARKNPGRRLGRDTACDGLHWAQPAPGCPFTARSAAPASRKPARGRKDPAARARARARTRTAGPEPDAALAAEVAELLGRLGRPK